MPVNAFEKERDAGVASLGRAEPGLLRNGLSEFPAFAVFAVDEFGGFGGVFRTHVGAVPIEFLACLHGHATEEDNFGKIRGDVEVGIGRFPAFAGDEPLLVMTG